METAEKTSVVVIPKSPWSQGRIGPRELQDWYRGCILAAKIVNSAPNYHVVVASGFKNGEYIETEFYHKILCEMVSKEKIYTISYGVETISQLDAFFSQRYDGKIIVISTFLHFPRVWWLCRGKGVKHKVVFGIPRPKEMIADIILTFVFPIIDILGMRQWFLKKVSARRESGKI